MYGLDVGPKMLGSPAVRVSMRIGTYFMMAQKPERLSVSLQLG